MNRLKGKVAIITGAARGLGEADARLFVAEGALVTITDIDQALGSALAAELGCHFIQQDVSDEARWPEVIEQTLERFGRLDILVNNAGMVKAGNPENQTTEEYRLTMAVHADGVFFGCRAAIPAMAASGGGSIINMSSVMGLSGTIALASYNASKGAVRLLSKSVAAECAMLKTNIRCNSIHPGIIDSDMGSLFHEQLVALGVAPSMEASEAGFLAAVPMGEAGQPSDIAAGVVYLASDASRYVTGSELVIDGGFYAT